MADTHMHGIFDDIDVRHPREGWDADTGSPPYSPYGSCVMCM